MIILLEDIRTKSMLSLAGVWENASKMSTCCSFYIARHNVFEYLTEEEKEKQI